MQIEVIDSDSEMSKYERFSELMELVQESGCDVPVSVCGGRSCNLSCYYCSSLFRLKTRRQ